MNQPKILDLLTAALRARHRSPRTIKTYRSWLTRFVRYHELRDPREMGTEEINQFLTSLAIDLNVAPSTQSQARAAILFFYREVLRREIEQLQIVRAHKPETIPTVLSPEEAAAVIDLLRGDTQLVAVLIYGAGPRISESLGLRIKDLDFDKRIIHIRQAKGARDRLTMLPLATIDLLHARIARSRARWEKDRELGGGWVPLPYAFDASRPERDARGAGSGSFLEESFTTTQNPIDGGGTTYTTPGSNERSKQPAKPPVSRNA